MASGRKMNGLGQRLGLDPVDEGRDDEADDHAPAGDQHEPQHVVAQGDEHVRVGEDEPVVLGEPLTLGEGW